MLPAHMPAFVSLILSLMLTFTFMVLPGAASTAAFRQAKSKRRTLPLQTKKTCMSQPRLTCVLTPTKGNRVHGVVTFVPQYWGERKYGEKCVVVVEARVKSIRPGDHGFHIHTYGDQRKSDGLSTGGHFTSPTGARLPHGGPDDVRRHWGDFGNLTAWKKGNAHYKRVDRVIRISGIIGRSMVVHAAPDKGVFEQPSGGAGARQASCVIDLANPDYN